MINTEVRWLRTYRGEFGFFFLLLLISGCTQPYSQGEALYEQHCSRCHGMDGQGFEDLYPPIASSPYISQIQDGLVCTIVYGSEYLERVKGEAFHVPMPGNTQLTQVEVLNVINFLSWEFGDGRPMKILEVAKALEGCE